MTRMASGFRNACVEIFYESSSIKIKRDHRPMYHILLSLLFAQQANNIDVPLQNGFHSCK